MPLSLRNFPNSSSLLAGTKVRVVVRSKGRLVPRVLNPLTTSLGPGPELPQSPLPLFIHRTSINPQLYRVLITNRESHLFSHFLLQVGEFTQVPMDVTVPFLLLTVRDDQARKSRLCGRPSVVTDVEVFCCRKGETTLELYGP